MHTACSVNISRTGNYSAEKKIVPKPGVKIEEYMFIHLWDVQGEGVNVSSMNQTTLKATIGPLLTH